MSDNEKESNLLDSATSESGLGSMNPSLSVSELEGQAFQTADLSSQSVTENNVTEDIIINNAKAKSTPVVTKIREPSLADIMYVMNKRFDAIDANDEKINKRFDANDEKFDRINCRFDVNDTKFDQLSNDIKEQKIKCEQQNIKNDINFKELKEQNIKFEQSISVKFDDLSNVHCKRCLLYTSRCV